MDNRSTEALWRDYHFLTKEMHKFLNQKDLELFYELVNQRERLQALIENTPKVGFITSPEGQKLFSELKQLNQEIQYLLQNKYSKAKHNRRVTETYTEEWGNPNLSRIDYQR